MRKKSGMSLIDVLGSFMIVAILSVSITTLLLSLTRRGTIDRKRITANQVAELYAENVNKSVKATEFYTLNNTTKQWTVTGLFSGKGQLLQNLSTSSAAITSSDVKNSLYSVKLDTQDKVDKALGNGTIGSSMIGKNLFDSDFQMVVNGTVYDSNNVEIYIANKNTEYRVVVILICVEYSNGKIVEVMRDANTY